MRKNPIFRLVFALFLGSCLLVSAYADADKEEELFFIAQKSFEDGFYDVSLGYFERFLQEYPETQKRPEAFLMIGRCYFNQR
ncbi:hypothetical protein ACFL38_05225, partial [Candidatus Omnitrophota bacterium]